jgi:hypothetical protein
MIQHNREPGYELCYLDGRRGVDARVDTSQQPMFQTAPNHVEAAEARWLVWGRSVLAVGIVAVLVALGLRTSRRLPVARRRGRRAVERAA